MEIDISKRIDELLLHEAGLNDLLNLKIQLNIKYILAI